MYINAPKHTLIEKVAGELAGTFFEIAANDPRFDTKKYKSAKMFARKNFEKFVPFAVDHLTSMLGRSDLPTIMKDQIYDALLERANDRSLDAVAPVDKIIPFRPDDFDMTSVKIEQAVKAMLTATSKG